MRAGSGRGLCHAFTYTPGSVGWAGVFWQYPADNWGTELGRPVPAGAKSVSFYAWSDAGGEVIQFGAGLQDHDAFAIVNPAVTLKSTPTRYTISLDGVDYAIDVTYPGYPGVYWGRSKPIRVRNPLKRIWMRACLLFSLSSPARTPEKHYLTR